jgi:hypothetical protein
VSHVADRWHRKQAGGRVLQDHGREAHRPVEDGRLRSVPAGWTDVDPPDPFVVIAAGRSAFRAADLLALACLLDGIRPPRPSRRVKRTSPRM